MGRLFIDMFSSKNTTNLAIYVYSLVIKASQITTVSKGCMNKLLRLKKKLHVVLTVSVKALAQYNLSADGFN